METRRLLKVNLCSGSVRIPGFTNVDFVNADVNIDLEKELLPFDDGSVEVLVSISAINYFSPERAAQIVRDVHRVLSPGGIARFGVQDLRVLARKYLERDHAFYFEKIADGRDRYPGRTFAEKFNAFFYGFAIADKHCKQVYDFETLKLVFEAAGFPVIEERRFRDSRIAGIEGIDNRPEQMFFLEAVKAPQVAAVPPFRAEAQAAWATGARLWQEGHRSQAWQFLLRALDLAPAEWPWVMQVSQFMINETRFDDAQKALADYLALVPAHEGARTGMAQVQAAARRQAAERQAASLAPAVAEETYGRRDNRVQPDLYHLTAAMKWLRRAQAVQKDHGVAAHYSLLERRWGDSYPETTGYIMATCLAFRRLTGEAIWLEMARAMGNWEISIQSPIGGVGEPTGVYIKRPRVFNTGQIMLGWLALFRETGDAQYLEATERAALFITACLDDEGKWSRYTYNGPKTYKIRVVWALLELYQVTGKAVHAAAAERALRWLIAQIQPNGWCTNTSLTHPDRPWTHLVGYYLVGFLEICRLDNIPFDRARLLGLLSTAAENIVTPYLRDRQAGVIKPYLGLPATYAPDWTSTDSWSCVTGNTQIEFFLRRLRRFVEDDRLLQAADLLMEDIKRLQLIDGIANEDAYGGLPGAHPINGNYLAYAIPNWGVKFYADSLLQRLLPAQDLYCIG